MRGGGVRRQALCFALAVVLFAVVAAPASAEGELDNANVELTYKRTHKGKVLNGVEPIRLSVVAPIGTQAGLECTHKACKERTLTTKRRTTTVTGLKRFLSRGTVLVVRLTRPGTEGVRFAITVRKGAISKTRRKIPLPVVPPVEVPPVVDTPPVVETPPAVETPPPPPLNLGPNPIGAVEIGSGAAGFLHLAGWTLDPDDPKTPNSLHVYVDAPAGTGQPHYVGASVLRPDVAKAFPIAGPDHGFSAAIPLPPGPHGIWVYAINTDPAGYHPLLWTATVNVAAIASGSPYGSFDSTEGRPGGKAVLRGWTVDPDAPIAPTGVHVYIDGPAGSGARGVDMGAASASRPDVSTARPGVGESHGFDYVLDGLAPGVHAFWVYAINKAGGGENPLLGVLTARVPEGG